MKKKTENSTDKAETATSTAPMVVEKATKSTSSDNEPEARQKTPSPKRPAEKAEKQTETKTQKAAAKHPASSKTPAAETAGKGRLFFVVLALVIAFAGAGLAAYDFWLLRLQAPINGQFVAGQRALETRIAHLEQQLQSIQGRLTTEQQARKDAEAEHQALNAAMQRVNEKLGRSTLAWRMAEVEYLLTVANDRLLLAKDRQTAITVLETADSRLKAMGDPALLKVRKKIAEELTALRAVPEVDIPGLVLTLASLAEAVPQLPLQDKKRLAVATEKHQRPDVKDWKQIPAMVWQDIKSLVQVRRHQQPTEPLLPPQQAGFLYQNLQLKLEQAKLAALQRNTAVFEQSLRAASQWLESFFVADASAVQAMQTTLGELQGVELQPTLPDVSGSLRELRALINARATQAAKEAGES